MIRRSERVVPDEPVAVQKTKVVYLIGSGLTNATASRVRHGSDMIMSTLTTEVVLRLRDDRRIAKDRLTGPLINKLIELSESESTPNLEELIDLLESSGRAACTRMAEKLSSTFVEVLLTHLRRIVVELSENLAAVLLDLHSQRDGPEELVGIITTNYDTLIELAAQSTGYYTDYGFECPPSEENPVVLLKLHGSLDWEPSVPVGLRGPTNFRAGRERVWMGPRRSKVASQYPFDLIWGKARELLSKADLIRVIGCSLLPTDWHIAQLLFRSSVLDSRSGDSKEIQVVNRVKECDRICEQYRMLRFVPIYRIEEVVRTVRAQETGKRWIDTIQDRDYELAKKFLETYKNPVEYWLQSKIQLLLNTGRSIDTATGHLRAFAENRSLK